MPRARTPPALAAATAADIKNPGRHADRKAVKGLPALGAPSAWMGKFEVKAFDLFKAELPWLKESDRLLVEMAATLRGRLLDPKDALPFQPFQELRRCLGQLGATPADQSRVSMGDGAEGDPDEGLFDQPTQGKTH